MIFELLAFGTIWFWVSLLFISCLISYLLEGLEESHTGWSSILIAASAFSYGWANWETLKNGVNWYAIGIFAIGFVVIGIIWSFFKWWRFLVDKKERYNIAVLEYNSKVVNGYKQTLNYYLYNQARLTKSENGKVRPRAADNKAKIVSWISYWPWSMLAFVLIDLIKNLADTLYKAFYGWYEKVSTKVFGGDI